MTGDRRVLVTGASGFIGRHVVPLLVERGFEVHAAARRPLDEDVAGVVQHRVDLLADGEPRRIVQATRPTHLMHLAWNATPGRFWTALDNLDWVAASLQLAAAFADVRGRRAVFAGTCAEYDWRHEWLDESSTALLPATLYGQAKNAVRTLVETAAVQTRVSTAWCRIFFLYGPHEAEARLVPQVISSLLQGRPALCTEGTQERDFMHVEDVARAFVAVLESDWQGPVNIASGTCIPLRRVIEISAELAGRADLVRLGARPTAANEPPRLAAATEVLMKRIGFRPKHGLQAGLEATVAWWRSRMPPS